MLKYYESYRASVIADALPGFTEFAKNTPTQSSQFENFSDYLTYVTNDIANAINHNNKHDAMRWIREHQFAVKQMFEKMVEGYKNPFEYGWKSYKFSRARVEFDKFTLVPDTSYRAGNKPMVYGSEMEIIANHPLKDQIAEKLLALKKDGACYVKVEEKSFKVYWLQDMNKQTVVDWTGVI